MMITGRSAPATITNPNMDIDYANEWHDRVVDAIATTMVGAVACLDGTDYMVEEYDDHDRSFTVRKTDEEGKVIIGAASETIAFATISTILVY